jgi:hypothetical protein
MNQLPILYKFASLLLPIILFAQQAAASPFVLENRSPEINQLMEEINRVRCRCVGSCPQAKAEAIASLILNIKPKVCVEVGVFGGSSFFSIPLTLRYLSSQIYPNNLKNREFDKEVPQIFCSEREAVFMNTARSEDEKSGVKPTPSKTDSSGCLGIINLKNLVNETSTKTYSSGHIGRAYAIDSWNTADCVRYMPDFDQKNKNHWSSVNFNEVIYSFKNNLQAENLATLCTVYQEDSVEAAAHFADNSIDFLHWDGNHSFLGAKRELSAYLPKVKSGGYVMISDVNWAVGLKLPIFDALDVCAPSWELIDAIDDDNIYLLKKP